MTSINRIFSISTVFYELLPYIDVARDSWLHYFYTKTHEFVIAALTLSLSLKLLQLYKLLHLFILFIFSLYMHALFIYNLSIMSTYY